MISVVGLEPYRVYQRNEKGYSDIPFELRFSSKLTGSIQISIASPDDYSSWQTMNTVEHSDRIQGLLPALPIGQHRIRLRAVDDDATEYGTVVIEPIYVGDLWVLAGQSNMRGFGKLTWTERPQPGVSCFYLNDEWDIAVDPLSWLNESSDPIHWTVPVEERLEAAAKERQSRTQGAGLGLSFGKEIFQHTGIPIGLIPCAKGATRLTDWDPGRLHEGGDSLYGALVRRVNECGGKIRGCLWYQGESDANEESTSSYRVRMRHLIEKLRHDLSDANLPFIYAQLSVHYAETEAIWWNTIQHEQFLLEQELEHVAMIPTIDASLSDVIHLDALSLQTVGKRMAWQALKLAYESDITAPGPRPAKPECFYWNIDRTILEMKLSGMNGELQDVERIVGFHVVSDDKAVPFESSLSRDKRSIIFQFKHPVPPSSKLWHGKGLNPLVSIIDQKQIPLIVFGPLPI